MRAIALAIALLPTMATAQELKPFDFMGYVAGEIIPAEKLKKCTKGPDATCIVRMVKVSTIYADYLLETHNFRLSSLYIDAHPNSYPALLEAFTAKYGEPCDTVDTVWKNAAGAELSNPTTFWCFKTGKLMFAKYGSRIDKMAILYTDTNKPPEPAPTINF